MICISDISGNITTVLPESLHQGSRGVNKIVLLAPFPSSAVVSVFLTLPNGMSLYPVLAEGADPNAYKMAAVDVALGVQKDGVDLNAWAYTMKAPVTEFSGTLTIQFSITMADSKLIDDGDETTNEFTFVEQLTTSAVNLPISRGVPTLSPTVTEEDLNTIEPYLTAALVAAKAAEQSLEAAEDAATRAGDEAGKAATSAYNAASSASRALGYATRAETAAANAEQDEALLDQAVTNAQTAAGAASASALEARQYERGALTAKDGAAEEAAKAVEAAASSATSEANAAASEAKAAASEAKATSAATRAEAAANDTEKLYNDIAPFKKRLENLESFNLFITDHFDSSGTVPARSAKYAVIDTLACTAESVKSYGANLLDGIALTTANNGVTFEKRTDGGYDLSTDVTQPPTATVSAYIYREGALLGDGDTITISIYGSTKGTRIRVSLLRSDNSVIGSLITLDDTTRSTTINKSDYAEAVKMNIIFAISAGTIVNGTAYIMVVNGDTPVKYYPYTPEPIDTVNYIWAYKNTTGAYIDFTKSVVVEGGDMETPIDFEAGSNFIKVQGAGKLVITPSEDYTGEGASITYQEGDYVFE